MAGLKYLKDNHVEVFENFEADPFVNSLRQGTQTLKEFFFDKIEHVTEDKDFVKNADRICYNHKLKGPRIDDLQTGEIVGTAMPFDNFIKGLKDQIDTYFKNNPNLGVATITLSALISKFREAAVKKSFKSIEDYIKELTLDSVPIKDPVLIMWSFRNKLNYREIFEGLSEDEITNLPCILGLTPTSFNSEYICFGHGSIIEAFKPTAMDAGMFKYWRVGGVTQPHPSCGGFSGKPEIVHSANLLGNIIVDQIKIIPAKMT